MAGVVKLFQPTVQSTSPNTGAGAYESVQQMSQNDHSAVHSVRPPASTSVPRWQAYHPLYQVPGQPYYMQNAVNQQIPQVQGNASAVHTTNENQKFDIDTISKLIKALK